MPFQLFLCLSNFHCREQYPCMHDGGHLSIVIAMNHTYACMTVDILISATMHA